MFQVGYRNVHKILQFFGHAKILIYEFGLFAKVAINLKGLLGICMGHFEIMFLGNSLVISQKASDKRSTNQGRLLHPHCMPELG